MGQGPSIPSDANIVRYYDLLNMVNTGDVILFCGRGISSSIIRFGSITSFGWSHAAVVVVMEDSIGNRIPYVIESNPPTGHRDFVTQRMDKSGPQMVELAPRLKDYDGFYVACRFLKKDTAYENDPKRVFWTKRLLEFVQKQSPDTKYDYNPIDFCGVLTRSNTDSSQNYFCTEFAAAALVYANILQVSRICENYSLDDFTSVGYLPTQPGLSYSREVYLPLPVNSVYN